MDYTVKWGSWYEDKEIALKFPQQWEVRGKENTFLILMESVSDRKG